MAINMTFPSQLQEPANSFGKATLQPCKLDATHGSLSSWVLLNLPGSSWLLMAHHGSFSSGLLMALGDSRLIMASSPQGYSWLFAIHGSSWLVLLIGAHGSSWLILAHHVSSWLPWLIMTNYGPPCLIMFSRCGNVARCCCSTMSVC